MSLLLFVYLFLTTYPNIEVKQNDDNVRECFSVFLFQGFPFYLWDSLITTSHTSIVHLTYEIYSDILAWQFDNMFCNFCNILYRSSLKYDSVYCNPEQILPVFVLANFCTSGSTGFLFLIQHTAILLTMINYVFVTVISDHCAMIYVRL